MAVFWGELAGYKLYAKYLIKKLVKKLWCLMTLKSKKTKFYNHKSPVFKKDVGIEKVLVSNKISCTIKNYKHFISYLHDNYKIKQLHIMLPKTSAYVKRCDTN